MRKQFPKLKKGTRTDTDTDTDRHTFILTDAHKQTDRHADTRTHPQTDRQTDRHTQTDTQTDRYADTQTDTETQRHIDMQRHRDTETHRDTQAIIIVIHMWRLSRAACSLTPPLPPRNLFGFIARGKCTQQCSSAALAIIEIVNVSRIPPRATYP